MAQNPPRSPGLHVCLTASDWSGSRGISCSARPAVALGPGTAGTGGMHRTCSAAPRAPQTLAGGRATRAGGCRPSPQCPWRDAASAPAVISGGLGGRGGAAGSSVAPKSGSPTSRSVLIFPSSILKSFCFLKYFSISLNIWRLMPRPRVLRGGVAALREDGDRGGHPGAGPEVRPEGQMSPGPHEEQGFHPRRGWALLRGGGLRGPQGLDPP